MSIHYLSTGVALADLPEFLRRNGSGIDGYIYVIGFTTGTVKAGRTNNPRGRIKAHLDAARKFGAGIAALWLSVRHANYMDNERELLSLLGKPDYGSEYFTSVSFAEAVAAAEKRLSFEVLSADERAARETETDRRAKEKAQALIGSLQSSQGVRITLGKNMPPWLAHLLYSHEPDLPPLSLNDGSDLDERRELMVRFSELSGISLIELGQWSFLDMLRHMGHQQVELGYLTLRARALETGRTDLVKPNFYGVEDGGLTLWSEPENLEVEGGSVVVGAGESSAGEERAWVRIDRGSVSNDAYLTVDQVEELIDLLDAAREVLRLPVGGAS